MSDGGRALALEALKFHRDRLGAGSDFVITVGTNIDPRDSHKLADGSPTDVGRGTHRPGEAVGSRSRNQGLPSRAVCPASIRCFGARGEMRTGDQRTNLGPVQ